VGSSYIPWQQRLHCKKRLAVFPSPAGKSLAKLSLDTNNQNIKVWLVTSRLWTGRRLTFFYSVLSQHPPRQPGCPKFCLCLFSRLSFSLSPLSLSHHSAGGGGGGGGGIRTKFAMAGALGLDKKYVQHTGVTGYKNQGEQILLCSVLFIKEYTVLKFRTL
jgi:hypothetical protein